MRFILAVIKGELVVSNRKKAEIEVDLEAAGYDRMAKKRVSVWPMDMVKHVQVKLHAGSWPS